MFDLHTHSLLSDGQLLPSEIARRYEEKGYRAIAITDHVDYSNIKLTVSSILEFCRHWPKKNKLKVIPGVELTHLPLGHFKPLARYARQKGIKIIVAHGESPVEPVAKGTNRAALEADIDILAHPGLITVEDVGLAKKKGVFLELTARKGHRLTNGYVAGLAKRNSTALILNSDSHAPEDILEPEQLKKVAFSCGLTKEDINIIYKDLEKFLDKYL